MLWVALLKVRRKIETEAELQKRGPFILLRPISKQFVSYKV
jgi:hypothetical protein